MDDSALRMALKRLLAHGEAAEDSKMQKFAASKKPGLPSEPCPECKKPMMGDACECGYEKPKEDESELADLLEQG
jgi:hypothetical protein